jgi:hypothetical protein
VQCDPNSVFRVVSTQLFCMKPGRSRSNQSRSEMAAGQSAWQEAIRPSSFKRQKARQGGGVQVLANIPGPGS